MIIYLAMIFLMCELLSLIFNSFFHDVIIFGLKFPLNISVVFFCLGFFILDLVTELYDNQIAEKLIYGEIACQILFALLAQLGIIGAGLKGSQIAAVISSAPIMIINSVIASFIGYKVTVNIMQYLKVRYNGQFLSLRYLCSSLPGEVIFSLIFGILSFSSGKTFNEFLMIFLTLTFLKLLLSFVFSVAVIPITNVLRLFIEEKTVINEFIPFK